MLGLVAARLTERYHRPSVAIGMADGVGKGSARSVAGFDLGGAVIAARQAGLLVQGGGHPMAAGLTVEAAKLPALEAFLAERVVGVPGLGRPAPRIWRSTARSRSRGSFELAERLAKIAPFGRGNPEPRFMLHSARAGMVRQVGGAHVDCRLYDPAGGGRVRAVAFRASDQPLGRALLQADGAPCTLPARSSSTGGRASRR